VISNLSVMVFISAAITPARAIERAAFPVAGGVDWLAHGNPGDVAPRASASSEYTTARDTACTTSNAARDTFLLLAGGDKNRQDRDIAEASG
jgi:putative component of toxin-antitoxin plasmid stabilization module